MKIPATSLPLVLLLFTAGCETPLPRPVEIDAADICTQCKMAISERRYAAEIADAGGTVLKFDSVACLVRHAAAHGLRDNAAAWFVMDSDGKEWLDARQAFLVSSASIPGPMGDGVLAVRDRAIADELAKRFAGRILRFDDLWSK